MTRVLLIGCGKIATFGHLPALQALRDEGEAEVVVCDADAARAKAAGEAFGMPWVTDWGAAASDVDAIAVAVPPGPNAEIAAAAARLGRHVLCEKPPGRRAGDAEAMAAVAALNPDLVTMVAFNRRFNPLYRRAMERSLELGPPTTFYGSFGRNGLGYDPDDLLDDWITSSSSHAIDLAIATVGLPRSVSVTRGSVGGGPDNVWTVQFHGARGSAVLMLNYAAGRRVERYEWAGPGYSAALDLPGRAEWALSGQDPEVWAPEDDAYHHANGFTDEYRAFLSAVAGTGPRPTCDFAYGADFMAVVEAILGAPNGTLQPVTRRSEAAAKDMGPAVSVQRDSVARPVVLLHHPFAAHARFFSVDRLAALRSRCDVRLLESDGDAAWKEAQVVVTGRGAKGWPLDIVSQAPNLELVVILGASVRHYAAQQLIDRGVTVCNTADAVAQSVAEYCLMMSLAGLRNLAKADRAMHDGGWEGAAGRFDLRAWARNQPIPPKVRDLLRRVESKGSLPRWAGGGTPTERRSDLRGAVVGLIGWGHIARRFTELLKPFGCTVLVASETAADEELAVAGARRAALSEVLGSAKVISLHKGLTDETRGFLGADHLALIRPGSVLVNAARGELIDEAALLARLAKGDIVAGLDVYAEEPLPKNHPLRKLPNAILTPHHASTTAGEERRMGDEALDTLLAWADGKRVDGIDSRRLARMT